MSSEPQFLRISFVRSDGFTQLLTVGLGESVLIGRDLACNCRLDGRKVSRKHVNISYSASKEIKIHDNTSHNGTFLNGNRIMDAIIQHGDVITIGEWQGRAEFAAGKPQRKKTIPGAMPAIEMQSFSAPESDPFNEATVTTNGTDHLPANVAGSGASAPGSEPLSSSPGLSQNFRSLNAEESNPNLQQAEGQPSSLLGQTSLVDMTNVWQWADDQQQSELSAETTRAIPVVKNPIVQRISHTQTNINFGDIRQFVDKAAPTPSPFNVDAVALQLVFKVTETLAAASSLDAFLGDMTDSLFEASRAKAVVILLPDENTGELVPRVVKNRRQDESIQLSRTIIEQAIRSRSAVASEDASSDERFASGDSVLRFDLKAVLAVPMTRKNDVIGTIYLTRDLPFQNTEVDLVGALAHLIAMGLERAKLEEEKEREEQNRRTLERFHAPDVVRRLMMQEQKHNTSLFLETLTATILFCDLSGFTAFCEDNSPETVGRILNLYLGCMTDIVFSYGGTVDKYIGDAIMCIFGAPFQSDDDALRAVKCAISMRSRFNELLKETSHQIDQNLQVHIGINTGQVVAGTVGSSLRMEYTALGDAVNVAARLESVAQAGEIALGHTTAELVREHIRIEPKGTVSLKGRDEPVDVFHVPKDAKTSEVIVD
jgi:adenylate cyclase